jgi:hypothetical protein
MLCGALYMVKLTTEWSETPISEPVDAGWGHWALVLCLLLAVLGVAVLM